MILKHRGAEITEEVGELQLCVLRDSVFLSFSVTADSGLWQRLKDAGTQSFYGIVLSVFALIPSHAMDPPSLHSPLFPIQMPVNVRVHRSKRFSCWIFIGRAL